MISCGTFEAMWHCSHSATLTGSIVSRRGATGIQACRVPDPRGGSDAPGYTMRSAMVVAEKTMVKQTSSAATSAAGMAIQDDAPQA
jgi:hypothetical protein